MSRLKFIKDHFSLFIFDGVILIIINGILFTSTPLDQSLKDIIYLNFIVIFIMGIRISTMYHRWNNKFRQLHDQLINGDVYCNIPIKEDTLEEELLNKLHSYHLKQTEAKVFEVKEKIDEIDDYITKWVHEIKIPITVLELITNEIESINSVKARELRNEIERLKYFVGQALHIIRANSFSEDLTYQEVNLKSLIKEVIRSNMNLFINKNMELRLGDFDHEILTDTKWLTYICEQLINNACKYGRQDGWIEIDARKEGETVYLFIKDNGIGIPSKDIQRVWDKGFTGENGRQGNRSTGMGLYLVHRIVNQLGHEITIQSEQNVGTTVTLRFNHLEDLYVTKMSL